METNLFFVRHAHSIYTPDELERPLSDQGLNDSQMVTELLKLENIHYVISSPYKRAIQTIEGIAKYINQDIEIVDDFKERTLSVKPVEDFNFAISNVWNNFDFAWEGGESSNVAQLRGVDATLKLLSKYSGKNVVIGTHGNIMVLIMNYFDKKFNFHFWKKLDMPDIYKLTFDDNSLMKVSRIMEKYKRTV